MSLSSFKEIGDQLDTDDFNAIISLYRHFITHHEDIRIKDSVTGKYAKYLFDLEDTTILDSGMVVNAETIAAEPRVKLTDNVFKDSTYTLILEVVHYTGVNILDNTTSNFKVVDTLEIELIPDTWVDIPLDNIEEGYIISFNSSIMIQHDKTVVGE